MPVGGGKGALEIVAKRLGLAPFHPADGDPGELVLEFEWLGRQGGLVTDGEKYFVAVSMPVRIAALIGTWDLGRNARSLTVNGIRVYAYRVDPCRRIGCIQITGRRSCRLSPQ